MACNSETSSERCATEYVIVFLLMSVAVGYVAQPLLVKAPAAVRVARTSRVAEDLVAQRDAAYAGIKELEFEYELGNLSEADYQALRDEYRHRAAGVLRAIEALPEEQAGERDSDDSIDEQIERSVGRLRRQPALGNCPLCREVVAVGDRFCAECGALLSRFCSACGESLEPGSHFCRYCGSAVGSRV